MVKIIFSFKTSNIGPLEKYINCHKEVPLVSFRLHMSSCPGGSSKSASDQTDITNFSSEISVISDPKTGELTAGGLSRNESCGINSTAKYTN